MNEIAIRSLQAQIVGLREKLDKFETYYVHQDLLLGEQEKVATLEQRVKELETALFAATATVGSLEAKLVEAERERDAYKQDIHDEAGLLMVDVPEPGTDMAKVMRANRLMRHSRDRLREALQRHKHTDECLSYSAKTGKACCIAACTDSHRQALKEG